jgi:hypothetical protein
MIGTGPTVTHAPEDPTTVGGSSATVVEFHYWITYNEGSGTCRTADGVQRLQISDNATGKPISLFVVDTGETRIIDSSTWIRFSATITWDPDCLVDVGGGPVAYCIPATPGTYHVSLYDQGFQFDPITVEVTWP